MNEHVLYSIIAISYFAFFAITVFWIAPAKEERLRTYKEAVKIAQHFGNAKIELVDFRGNEGGTFVFVQSNDEKNHYVFESWDKEDAKSYKNAEKRIKMVCSLMPSYIPQRIEYRDFSSFCSNRNDLPIL